MVDYKTGYFRTDGQTNTLHGMGSHTNTVATTGVRFYGDSGTIDSGSFTLYGRKITQEIIMVRYRLADGVRIQFTAEEEAAKDAEEAQAVID